MFKVKNNLAAEIMTQLFVWNNLHYNLWKKSDFKLFSTRSVLYGIETISPLGPKIWNFLLPDTTNTTSITESEKNKVMVYSRLFLLTLQKMFPNFRLYTSPSI